MSLNDIIFEQMKNKFEESDLFTLKLNYNDIRFLICYIETLKEEIGKKKIDKTKNDVTYKYENMIQSFECDFNLPFNYGDFTIFDDIRRLIENKNRRLCKDIELLQELSFGIRYGNLKIVEVK